MKFGFSKRLSDGLFIAPLTVPLCYAALSFLISDIPLVISWVMFLGACLLSYLLMIFIGLPLHYILRDARLTSWVPYALSYLFIGVLGLLLFLQWGPSTRGTAAGNILELYVGAAIWLISCTATGVFFWRLVRPDLPEIDSLK